MISEFERINAQNFYTYRLRWRMDFKNRPSAIGMWDIDPPDIKQKACFQMREGLIRAAVEGKHQITREVVTLAEVDGWDFCNFQWLALWQGNPGGGGYQRHYGLAIQSRDWIIEVRFNGQVFRESRSEEDKKYHYAIYGR